MPGYPEKTRLDRSTPPLRPEEQAAFLRSVGQVRRAAARHLDRHPSEGAVIAFVRNLQHGVDTLLVDARRAGKRIDCKAGCSHCCHARVEARAPEIFAIAAEIESRPAAECSDVLARLEACLVAAPAADAPWDERSACPFLIDRLCSIYAVRPATCRKAHSTDVACCASHSPAIPQDLEVALGAEALIRGMSLAYDDRGLDGGSHELVSAVVATLRDPSMSTRWFAGESVFHKPEDVDGT